MKIRIFVLMLSLLMIIGCSEDTTAPTPDPEDNTDNLLPSNTGNYWMYEIFGLDSVNNKIAIGDEPIYDSVVVLGQENILTRLAFVFNTFRLELYNSQDMGKQYFYKEGEKIFTHSGIFNTLLEFPQFKDIELPFMLPEQWIPFIDPSSGEWNIYEKALNGDTAIYQGNILRFYGTLKIKGKKDGKEIIKIDTANHKAHKFTITISFAGYFTVSIFGEEHFEANFSAPLNFWFVNNIGLAKRTQQSFFITLPFLGNRYILGSQAECIRYSVNYGELID